MGILMTLWFVGVAARLLYHRRESHGVVSRGLLSFGFSILIFGGLLYYTLVVLGLFYWNNVITWDLIRSYAVQIRPLAGTLEVPLLPVVVLLGLGHTLLWMSVARYLALWDWTEHALDHFRPTTFVFGAGTLVVLLVILSVGFSRGHWAYQDEPLSLTFRPPPYQFQNHGVSAAQRAQNLVLDQQARAEYLPNPTADRRNVILLVVDALRPDHMGVLGYHRNTTPFLSDLARRSDLILATSVSSVCAESLCGLLGLAASNYNHGFSEHPFTLQEVLRKHRYGVHMLLSGDHTNFYGLRDLYGDVDTFIDGSMLDGYPNDDSLLVDMVREFPTWDGSPTMFQFHLMGPHLLVERPAAPRYAPSAGPSVVGVRASDEIAERRREIVNFYDNGVRKADWAIEEILGSLEEKGYLDDAVVVLTADHGEHLGEHGLYGHANSVYEPVLKLPLLIYDISPSDQLEAFEAEGVTSVVDLAPTLLRMLEMPRPSSWVGDPLQYPIERPAVFFQQGPLIGFVGDSTAGGPWKFWIDVRSGERRAVNLRVDSEERCNLVGALGSEILQGFESRLREAGSLPGVSEAGNTQNILSSQLTGHCLEVNRMLLEELTD